MSENTEDRNRFLVVDDRRGFPPPLAPPMRIERANRSGMHAAIRIVVGIIATTALAMIIFGVANYELASLGFGLEIPVYGVALLIFSFALFNVLRYIGENG